MKTNLTLLVVAIWLMLSACTNKFTTNRSDADQVKAIDEAFQNNLNSKSLCTGWYYVIGTKNDFSYQLNKSYEVYHLDPNPIAIKVNIKSTEIYEASYPGQLPEHFGLKIQLDDFGASKWADATQKAIGKKLAFILDNQLIYTGLVNAQITGGITAINRPEYNKKELEAIKAKLE